MDLKKIDIKTWFIIILGVALIISFIVGQKNNVDTHKTDIEALHKANSALILKNDSLKEVNKGLDAKIARYDILLKENANLISSNEKELGRLKNKLNEIPNYVKYLSANGVTSNLTDYLQKRTENTDKR